MKLRGYHLPNGEQRTMRRMGDLFIVLYIKDGWIVQADVDHLPETWEAYYDATR